MNGVSVSVPLKNHAIDLDDIKNNITDKTKVIWLCNPNNPTGTTFGKSLLEKFLADIYSDIIVVLDEAYNEFVTSSDYPDSIKLLDKHPNIISLRTFSKVYGLASLRVGYGIASLNDEDFKMACIENNINGEVYLYKVFKDMNLEYIPTDTNFIMVNVENDSVNVAEEILKKGISVRAGKEFGMPTWLRITIGKPEENQLLVEKLREVLSLNIV